MAIKEMEDTKIPEKVHLTVCEDVKFTGNYNDFISVMVEEIKDGKEIDGGYLHVYGVKEIGE